MKEGGFTLIEVVVALLILSMSAVAVTEALLTAQRAQRLSSRWMRAVELADEAMELGRKSRRSGSDEVGDFRREWTVETADADLGLSRIEVSVDWSLPTPQHFTLTTLMR